MKMHLQSRVRRAAAVVAGSGWRLPFAEPDLAAPVEGRLDGDGGVARAVEPQRRAVAGVGGVAGDDPGQVVCSTQDVTRNIRSSAVCFIAVAETVCVKIFSSRHSLSNIKSCLTYDLLPASWSDL